MSKLIRITTVSGSLEKLLQGQLKFMSQYFDVVGIASSGEALHNVNQNEGIRVIPVEMTRQITPIKDIKSVWKLYRIFKKEKPEIVHTHTPKAGTVGMIAAKLAGVPQRLHTIAGLPLLEATGFKRRLLNAVERLTYACATMIYPNSFVLKQIIINNKFCSIDKLKVIANGSSNGINTSHFDPSLISLAQIDELRISLNIKKEDFVFLFVGRMVKDKGINELVSAFKIINNKYQNIKLLLVGIFERELDPLFNEAEMEIKNNPNIIEAGYQIDVRPYFAISDVLAFPSYREGFPNVVMQAGAMGLPSIVTDINGCNEIIENGKNGVIIPPKDKLALIGKLEEILIDDNLRNKLKDNARKMITSRYEQSQVWYALLEEYKSIENQHV